MEHVITVHRRMEGRSLRHRVCAGLICNFEIFEIILLKKKNEKKKKKKKKKTKKKKKNGMGVGEEEPIKKKCTPGLRFTIIP